MMTHQRCSISRVTITLCLSLIAWPCMVRGQDVAPVPSSPSAQTSKPFGRTAGLFVGIQYVGSALDISSAYRQVNFGSGYGLHAGIGLGNSLAVIVNFDRTLLPGKGNAADSLRLLGFDALLRIHTIAGPRSPIRPFFMAGASGRAARGSREFTGISPTAGGGVLLKILPQVALTGTALWTFGNLTSKDDLYPGAQEDSFKATGARLMAGASIFLF
jgi:hypothetical protein